MEKKKKVASITVKANKKGRHIMPFLNFLRVLLLPILWIFLPFKIYGKRKVQDGACLYVSNHYRMLDVMYPAWTTWEGIHFIAKDELARAPIVGAVAKKVKVLFASRDGNDARVVINALKCLKNGEKVCLFPEGTGNKTNDAMLPFKSGATVLAIKSKAPIVPIMIYQKQRFFRRAHILMGEPIEFSEFYDKKLTEELVAEADQKLIDLMLKMRADHTALLESKKKR
jgi:1-acyl-sn-glycerol-3-phosphate acyltransferase